MKRQYNLPEGISVNEANELLSRSKRAEVVLVGEPNIYHIYSPGVTVLVHNYEPARITIIGSMASAISGKNTLEKILKLNNKHLSFF